MGRRIDISGWTHWAISRFSQSSRTGVTEAVVCYPVCGMIQIKELLPLIGKISPGSGSGFLLSLSDWFFTICLTPYNRKYNVSSASLKNSSFLPCRTKARAINLTNLTRFIVYVLIKMFARVVVNTILMNEIVGFPSAHTG